MTRTAPSWFVKWLKANFEDRSVRWNDERMAWEILVVELQCTYHRKETCPDTGLHVLNIFEKVPVLEMTWPHREITSRLCEQMMKGAWFKRNERFKDYWQAKRNEDERVQQSKRKTYTDTMKEVRKDGAKALAKDLGQRTVTGYGKNVKLGNPLK